MTARDADGTPRELMAAPGRRRGRRSARRWRGTPARRSSSGTTPPGRCFYTYVGGVDWDGIQLHVEDDAFAGVFPTHHGEACVWLIRPARRARAR